MAIPGSSKEWQAEAECFAYYLIGEAPKAQTVELYARAMRNRSQNQLPKADDRMVCFAVNHPWSIGYLDAGLALSRPHAELRQRLCIMLAILETAPEYVDRFLPSQHSRIYIFAIGWAACKASFKALVGLVFIRLPL